MTSFLTKCPRCGAMIPRQSPCPSCHYSEQTEADAESARDLVHEYRRRRGRHVRNYTLYMILMLATGLVGLLTAYLWVRVIYLGDVGAFILVGVMTVFSAILGGLLAVARRLFPTDLACPACGVRLDEVGVNNGHCPGCHARLA